MSFSKDKRSAIQDYILDKITVSDSDFVRKTMDAFSISLNTVYRYLRDLLAAGAIEKKRNGVYSVVDRVKQFTLLRDRNELVDEQKIYDKHVYDEFIEVLPENVRKIWNFSFTEMMNNAIDHSCAKEVRCLVSANRLFTLILIFDNGIGLFKNIKDWFGLDSIDDAIAELFKGRITTDSANHSGEGIFFTSRFLDDFAVISDGKIFTRNRYDEIVSDLKDVPGFEKWQKNKGTIVMMKQSNNSNRRVEEIIDRFSDEETSEFSKTVIPIKDFFETYPVSRSQAKRLCARLDVFNEIELDFTGVSDMGQGFADEVFRVFQNRNPEIIIKASNMIPGVERMYRHVKSRS